MEINQRQYFLVTDLHQVVHGKSKCRLITGAYGELYFFLQKCSTLPNWRCTRPSGWKWSRRSKCWNWSRRWTRSGCVWPPCAASTTNWPANQLRRPGTPFPLHPVVLRRNSRFVSIDAPCSSLNESRQVIRLKFLTISYLKKDTGYWLFYNWTDPHWRRPWFNRTSTAKSRNPPSSLLSMRRKSHFNRSRSYFLLLRYILLLIALLKLSLP